MALFGRRKRTQQCLLLGEERTRAGRYSTSANDPGRSLIPGLRSKTLQHILAGIMVLSAVGACPPHDGVG